MLQIKPLPEHLQKAAIAELKEIPEKIPEYLQHLKIWIEQQPQLKARTDDQFLVQFLRDSKYNLEKAKSKLTKFYEFKRKHSDFFSTCDIDDPVFQGFHKTGSYSSLPMPLNGNGPRIIYLQINFPPHEFDVCDMGRYAATISEMMIWNDPYACINGLVMVQDYSKIGAKHMGLLSLSRIRQIFQFYTKCFPIQIKGIYYVNLSTFAYKSLKLLQPCVPETVRNQIFLCGKNLDDLSDKFPRKYFPKECGGENGSLADLCSADNNLWDEYRGYLKQNSAYGSLQ